MINFVSIDKQFLSDRINQFIAILRDVKHEYWKAHHFLQDLPGKWELSICCVIDNQIVGYIIASYKPNSVHVHKFMVNEKHRSREIGKKLLIKFFSKVEKISTIKKITLKVYQDNPRGVKFYKNKGFKIVCESSGLYNMSYNLNNRIDRNEKIFAAHQPNFIPWLGFFNKIANSDVFIITDSLKYSKESVANRNKIKGPNGEVLISVPISKNVNGSCVFTYDQAIIANSKWYLKFFKSLELYYSKANYFDQYYDQLRFIFMIENFSNMNIEFIKFILKVFSIKTEILIMSSIDNDFGLNKNERIVNFCKYLKSNIYLSGQGAKKYNDPAYFEQEGIILTYQNYEHPKYQQQFPPFVSHLSVVDLLLNCGPDGRRFVTNK